MERFSRSLLRSYVRHAPTSAGKAVAAQRLLAAFRSHPEIKIARTVPGPRLSVEIDDLLPANLYLFGVWEPNPTAYGARCAPRW